MSSIYYKKINEDYLDDIKIDIRSDSSSDDERYVEPFDGTFHYRHPFKFIVCTDFSKCSDTEYTNMLNDFFDRLWQILDRCPYIKNYDKYRVVNTVGYYFDG